MPAPQVSPEPPSIWTIGHSSRAIEEFEALLRTAGVEVLADVRRHPGSRTHPHFAAGPLAEHLAGAGVAYAAFPELGGRRQPRPDSPHTVWRNDSFRGYADYMDTCDFAAGVERLIGLSRTSRVCMMCSEAVWWRCHRALIADSLKAGGWAVLHIMDGGSITEHPYTSAARIVEGRLTYGPASASTARS
jgi:uncharacterized protein (DUF488 family)